MEVPFKLVVKTPNQRIGDLQVDCQSNWTVQRLKQHLSDVYPTKPESSSQKLIYSGRLLQDSLTLGDVFDQQGEAHTVHIVCATTEEEESPSRDSDRGVSGGSFSCSSDSQSGASLAFGPPNVSGLRHRGTQQTAPQPISGIGQLSSESYQPTLSSYMQQMTQFQMQNMMQYWTRPQTTGQIGNWQQWQMAMEAYNTYLASSIYAGTQSPAFLAYQQLLQSYPSPWNGPPSPSSPTSPVSTESTPSSSAESANRGGQANDGDLRQAQAQAQPLPERNQRQQGVRMNAGGAMFEDDDDDEDGVQNRDWLDWTHTLLRVGVLFSIMYFYSTMSRLLLVCILGFIIYLYQAGYFSARRAAPVEDHDIHEVQDNNANRINDNGDYDRNDAENEEVAHSANNAQEGPAAMNPPPPGVMTIMYSFITSFFTSLIPTGPPPIQQP